MKFDLLQALLETEALRLPPPGEVFWYTSGTVGPYYINTHYLYGGPEGAEELLAFIDAEKEEEDFPHRLQQRIEKHYAQDAVYRRIIDELVAQAHASGADFDFVSGGERRDWFFSLAVAEHLDLPHLLIYKDLRKVLLDGTTLRAVGPDGLNAQHALHVADLVTEASSFFRAWIPAIAETGARIAYAANVIDRGQGGIEALNERGVRAGALMRVDSVLFRRLVEIGRIDEAQFEVLASYYRDPQAAMKSFLEAHPDFLRAALDGADPKVTGRARLLIDENPYGLDESLWRE